MSNSVKRLEIFLLGLCSATALAAPQMETGTFLNDGANFLSVSYMSAPAVLDWNNDGRKDLLVGDYYGYIELYLNQGTDARPSFNGGTRLTADGMPIRTDDGG